jgi:hypothetical protein
MKTYICRKVCETETEGKSFHYFYAEQAEDAIDENITCPDHPEAQTKDFVIQNEKQPE